MKIQQQNSYNPNMKALYFAKTTPLCNKSLNYVNKADQKISKNGFKYLEDKVTDKSIKKRIANIPFVKEMAKKFETFVVYTENKYGKIYNNQQKEYLSMMEMFVVDTENLMVKNHLIMARDDDSLLMAREKFFQKANKY